MRGEGGGEEDSTLFEVSAISPPTWRWIRRSRRGEGEWDRGPWPLEEQKIPQRGGRSPPRPTRKRSSPMIYRRWLVIVKAAEESRRHRLRQAARNTQPAMFTRTRTHAHSAYRARLPTFSRNLCALRVHLLPLDWWNQLLASRRTVFLILLIVSRG